MMLSSELVALVDELERLGVKFTTVRGWTDHCG